MNIEIANALAGYIETLYILNQKLIKLCGTDVIDKYEYSYKEILDIIQDIPRLIPYKFNKKEHILQLVPEDGLLEYKSNISYLEEKYEDILDNNYELLDNIRKVRNKYEHKMHYIRRKSSGSGTNSYFDFEFEISGESVVIRAVDFIKLIKKTNILFSLIVKDIQKYSYENNKTDYPYYRRLCRFDFEDFNKLYDSELLRTFGTLMLDY